MNTNISYMLSQAIDAAQAVLPHIASGRDEPNPAITAARITLTEWVATDRYTVAWREIEAVRSEHEGDGDAEILLPLDAVTWVAKIATRTLLRYAGDNMLKYHLRVSAIDSDAVEVAIMFGDQVERSQAFAAVRGNFPAVERLFDSWEPHDGTGDASLLLRPQMLERVTTYARRARGTETPLRVELGTALVHGKPSPVRVTVPNDGASGLNAWTGNLLTVLIQPNLDLNGC